MEQLYFPIDIPNFDVMQSKLETCLPHDYTTKSAPFAFNLNKRFLEHRCPELMQWINERSKVDILHYRIYITPPHSKLPPHIDGGGVKPVVPFRLNLPITGTKNTKTIFYNTSADNLKTYVPESYLSSIHPVDFKKLRKTGAVEISTPHFINTSVLHSVNNPNDTYRAMFVVTWLIDDKLYREVEDVFKIAF